MMFNQHNRRDKQGNYFLVPNEVFLLGLTPGEMAVYTYLLRCTNRKTDQCYPSYRTIAQAIKLSRNTVRKCVQTLEERGLITTEPTNVTTKTGRKRNGSLLYTICPIKDAVDLFHQRQMQKLEADAERQRIAKKLTAQANEECSA
jgi:predicted transcriptional regulator